jgi:long-chain acyl-CoA synthetase
VLEWYAPEMNIGDTLRHSAARFPTKPALVCNERVVSYQELDQATDALALWLQQQDDVETGDRIAIHWSNSIETVMLYYACFKAGLIAVPVNNRLKAPEIAYILQHSKAKLCFSQPDLAPLSEEARKSCRDLQHIYTSLPHLQADTANQGKLPTVRPERVAAVMYTSGTTANPKGVMHTHISLMGMTELMRLLGINSNDVVMTVTQMLHIAALGCVLMPGIYCGCTCVLLPLFEPGQSLDLIERWGVTYFLALPAILRFMVEEQGVHPRKVDTMRLCLAGGDTVPVSMQQRFKELFGVPVRELYGMTESVPMTCIPDGVSRDGSMGPALEIIDARVGDAEGNLIPDGEVGELQVLSPANCVGYWDDSHNTHATFLDGWLRTGDRVKRDAEGFFWFHARLKQIIVHGGSNISPQEVEEALYRSPAVLESGVIGMPDPVWGEKIIAFVAIREGHSPSEQDLMDFMRMQLAEYKMPERILFMPALPKGLTGKVQRRDLKPVAEQMLNA